MPEAVRGQYYNQSMEVNVNVNIGLAPAVQDLIKRVLSGLTLNAMPQQHPEVLPDVKATESNEIKTVCQEADNTTGDVPVDATPDVVDIATVRDLVSELVRSGKKPQIQELLTAKGVTGYSQLKGEELNEFYQEIKRL
jgi:hypothetical protein